MSPLPVDNLSQETPEPTVRDAISKSIEACMSEPIPAGVDVDAAGKNKWCAAKAYSIARQKTGKVLDYGK